MGQPNTSNSNTPQGPLHPLLQSALGCLEVQLDDELTRYRRQRSAQPSSNRPFKSNIRTKKKHTLDLISVKPSTNPPSPNSPTNPNHPGSGQPPTTEATSYPARSVDNGAAYGASNGHAHNGQAYNGQAHNGHAYNGGQPHAGTSSAIATLNIAQSPHEIAGMNSKQGAQGAIAVPSPTAPPHSNLAPITDPNRLKADEPAEPQDYLASSEHLLQSLVDEAQTAEHPTKNSWTSQLFTPLGIGSLLLLLVSSVGLGYVIVNPDALSNLTARWQADDDAANTNLDEPITPNASKFDPSGQPNLSSEEFVELDLGTLSTLPSNAPAPRLSPAPGLATNGSMTPPAPLAAPVTPSTTANGSAGTTSPSTSPSAAPSTSSAASSSAASRSPAPAAPSSQSSSSTSSSSSASRAAAPASPQPTASTSTDQAAASSGSSGSGAGSNRPPASNSTDSSGSETASSATGSASSGDYYHVVIPYTGDRSLNEARQVASDAYIHNSSSGATIRLGAFTDQASAQEMVQNLESQGLDANIED